MNSLNEDLGRGIILSGYRYKGRLLPESLSLFWELDEEYDLTSSYKMKNGFVSL